MARVFDNVSASQTDDTIGVPAQGSNKVRVYAVFVMAGGTATNVTFNSKGSGSGTAISPTFACGANGGAVLPYNPEGWFETNAGEALTVTTGAGSTVGICVSFDYLPGDSRT